MYCIYKITCTTTNESYIGLTKDIDQRLTQHKLPSSDCTRIRNAIQKYGWGSFVVTILDQGLTLEEANNRESVLINEHDTLSPNGYNLQTGGEHRVLSDESRLKISKTLMGRARTEETKAKCSKSHMGKALTEEHKQKIKETRLRGVPRSEETKAKISASQKGRPGRPGCGDNFRKSAEKRKGTQLTEEHRENIRKARTGTIRSEETKAKIRASLLAHRLNQQPNQPQTHDDSV